jgi:hypothetical protein
VPESIASVVVSGSNMEMLYFARYREIPARLSGLDIATKRGRPGNKYECPEDVALDIDITLYSVPPHLFFIFDSIS